MNKFNNIGNIILLFVILMALTACGPRNIAVKDDHKFTVDMAGLKLDKNASPTIVYKRPGAPGLDAYNRFIIDQVQIIYDDPDLEELTPEQVGEMQQYLRTAVIKELRDGGYEVGTRSQADTMRISFTISGLKASTAGGAANAAMMATGVAVGVPVGMVSIFVGEVTVEGVFREALTNRIDAVVVAHSIGSRLMKKKFWSTRADVEGAFDDWAEGFRKAVDEAHGG